MYCTRVLAVFAGALCACGGGALPEGEAPVIATAAEATAAAGPGSTAVTSTGAGAGGAWAARTESPATTTASAGAGALGAALAKCGREDGRLSEVARELAQGDERGGRDLSRTTEALRRAGVPQVWPRVWLGTADAQADEARAFEPNDVAKRVGEWRSAIPTAGERRCGTSGIVASGDKKALVFVTVDALADLAPLPTRAHAGSWLTVDASLLVPASNARVVVVGPDGKPRAVPASLDRGHIRATFAPDRPGRFTVQVLGDVGQGPRPLLEAAVFADVDPFEAKSVAPGEAAAQGGNDVAALARMVLALRAELGLGTLRRDPELDRLAEAHARAMKASGRVGHDVGDGDPKTRVERANLVLRQVGENVAHAESVVHAHRALYASPSHRENLIHGEFDRFGLAVLPDTDGSVWVAEMFAR